MKLQSLFTLVAVAVDSAAAHYIFQQFGTGNTKFSAWKYVRRNTNPAWLQNGPVTDLSSKDLRCNVGGGISNGTETLPMKAGDAFTFYLDTAVYHAGPTSVHVILAAPKRVSYMSKAPEAAADYDGSGPWFKIQDWGETSVSQSRSQPEYLGNAYTSNIPKCIPDGEYLLRVQEIGLHNPGAAPQFYISCAQVKITGGGTTSPSPTASIPGAFKANDPGLNVNIYGGSLTGYTVPGPKVFKC
ncbi:glycoside hydrolase [Lasiosphaeria hispida]|uniref:lytic cellulose monooxygenase (C4-dehydrogenating) n=1 Tax=Lasiosphaeria hispida TaxID=260671 RepID=A0AAJ0M8L8_9PEZI|nr:glycoside hydrolase [Lasiosphaeria hispida]